MIAVLGAGIIGLSIAWRLAQRGLGVTLLNAGGKGGEASPAGAGMLAPGGEFAGDTVWTPLGLESHAMYPAFVQELSADAGHPIDFRICGGLELALSDRDWMSLRERAQRQTSAGIECSEVAAGFLYPNDGYVDPLHVLIALRKACEARGVVIQERHTVDCVDASRFGALVIAAGAWSGDIVVTHRGRQLPLPKTIPVKGHLIGYPLEPGSMPRILRHGHTYLLQRANGFTIAGSTEERVGFNTDVDDDICRAIQVRAAELWPALASHAPSRCWVGFRPATEDLRPKIGRFESTNVWLAYGHYRNGILLAPITAQRIAADIASGC